MMLSASFDALVVEGRSPVPRYLWVHEGGAKIREAHHLWGLPTGEVESRLREELGSRIRVCRRGSGASRASPCRQGAHGGGGLTWHWAAGSIECKSVTLVRQGTAFFPDAPTERGRRHLAEVARIGGRAAVVFVVQRGDAVRFAPNHETDPAFGRELPPRVIIPNGIHCHDEYEFFLPLTPIPVTKVNIGLSKPGRTE